MRDLTVITTTTMESKLKPYVAIDTQMYRFITFLPSRQFTLKAILMGLADSFHDGESQYTDTFSSVLSELIHMESIHDEEEAAWLRPLIKLFEEHKFFFTTHNEPMSLPF